jgi:hypothetical protein
MQIRRSEVSKWINDNWEISRVDISNDEDKARVISVYQYLLSRPGGVSYAPLFLVSDIVQMLTYGERVRMKPYQDNRALKIYESSVLSPMLLEASFRDLQLMISEKISMNGLLDRATEIIIKAISKHVSGAWQFDVDPSSVRDYLLSKVWKAIPKLEDNSGSQGGQEGQEGQEGLEDQEVPLAKMADVDYVDPLMSKMDIFTTAIMDNILWRDLVTAGDIFEISAWEVLDTEAKRIGVRQISSVEGLLGRNPLPKAHIREPFPDSMVNTKDETTYPTGGLSGITNRGSMDNLVRSELVYIGEGGDDGGPSIFDVRFTENELLYYMRNDGRMRQKKRLLHVVVDLDGILEDDTYNQKSPGYTEPFSVMAHGIIVRTIRDILGIFSNDSLSVIIHYNATSIQPKNPLLEKVQGEFSLLKLSLSREINLGLVNIVLYDSTSTFNPEGFSEVGKGKIYCLAFTFTKQAASKWTNLCVDLQNGNPPVRTTLIDIGNKSAVKNNDILLPPIKLPIEGLPFGATSLQNVRA